MKKYLFFMLAAVAIVLTACSQPAKTLTGKWNVETVKGNPAVVEMPAFVAFEEGLAQVHGCSGCNNFFGPCTVNEEQLKFGELGATMRFCLNAESERDIMQSLFETASYKISKNTLFFYNENGDELMTLTWADEQEE